MVEGVYQSSENHNREIEGRGEWTRCPCSFQQVHFLALDVAVWPRLSPPPGPRCSADLYWSETNTCACCQNCGIYSQASPDKKKMQEIIQLSEVIQAILIICVYIL